MMAEEKMSVESENSVALEICPKTLSKSVKIDQWNTWEEITKAIGGLYNSGGGTVILRYNASRLPEDARKCMRMLEQKIQYFLGTITLSFDIDTIEIPPSPSHAHGGIKITVTTSTKTEKIITLRYRLFLPSSQLVMEVSPFENAEKLRALMFGGFPPVTPIKPGSHYRHFTKGTLVRFFESKTTQFKMLKAQPAKKTTFADRLVGKGNKFSHYVSAFANFAGGHIYFGIKDDGEVEGEFIDEKEKEKVKVKIHNVIAKMLWPKKREQVDGNEDKRWNVHFEPVTDSEHNVVPSLYVVVVFVAQCRCGVFAEEPECYKIVGGNQVRKVDFASWKKTFEPECYKIVGGNQVRKVDFASWKKGIDPRLTEEG